MNNNQKLPDPGGFFYTCLLLRLLFYDKGVNQPRSISSTFHVSY